MELPKDDAPVFVGELALDGSLRPVSGILPMILRARDEGRGSIFIPAGNAEEGELVDGINVFTAHHLSEIVRHLKGEAALLPLKNACGFLKRKFRQLSIFPMSKDRSWPKGPSKSQPPADIISLW